MKTPKPNSTAAKNARNHCRATVIVTDRKGRVLLTTQKNLKGAYRLPGGGIEAGENAAETAARELAEETGIVVEASELQILGEVRGGIAHVVILLSGTAAKPKPCAEVTKIAFVKKPGKKCFPYHAAIIKAFLAGKPLPTRKAPKTSRKSGK